jgi:hypothetical protein
VGGLGVCVGVCKFVIHASVPPAQSAAEKIGGGLADLLTQKLMKRK